MKRHIKASLITLAILAAFVGLVLTAAFYPASVVVISAFYPASVVIIPIYQLVLINLKKQDNEEI